MEVTVPVRDLLVYVVYHEKLRSDPIFSNVCSHAYHTVFDIVHVIMAADIQ